MKNLRGAVSLFVVIFATLLITVITVSFIRIMVTGQQEATSSDLSQSAYDSAQSGVEDAKRAIMNYKKSCVGSNSSACQSISSDVCNKAVINLAGVTESSDGKIAVGDNADQYYTCVKIAMDTDDYEGFLARNSSKLIPLVGDGKFDAVQIDWYTSADLGSGTRLSVPNTNYSLFSGWTLATPAVMRSQFIQFDNTNFKLSDFDKGSSSSTAFLYPTANSLNNAVLNQFRPALGGISTTNARCVDPNTSANGYSCTMRLSGISNEGSTGNSQTVFLRLSALYNSAHYRITLYNTSSNQQVKFNSVQPEIDSTGQASDLFRRVKARVELNSNFIYPEAAVDTTSDFCKNFLVTNSASDYKDNCSQN